MTPFLRPEVAAFLSRWREPLAAGALALLGALWLLTGGTLLRMAGAVLLLLGVALALQGIRRARFVGPGGGAGVVEVDERRITYFGPDGGAAVSLDALNAVEIVTTGAGPVDIDLYWVFHTPGELSLNIPGDAENAQALFDALSALPGARFDRALAAASSTEDARFVIWQKPVRQLH